MSGLCFRQLSNILLRKEMVTRDEHYDLMLILGLPSG